MMCSLNRKTACKKIAAIFLLSFLFLLTCVPAYAAESSGSSDRVVKVGMFTGEGYAEQDAEGQWDGIDIEVTENLAQTAGFRVEFVEEEALKTALEDLEDGKIDMLADIAKTAEREEKYLFSEYEQGNVNTNIFVREDDGRWDYENFEQLRKMTFGCEKEGIAGQDFREWSEKHGFSPVIKQYESGDEAAAAVMRGEIDAYVDGEDSLPGYRSVLSFAPSPYYYIFTKDKGELKTLVDSALGQIYMQDPLYGKELLEKYVGIAQNQKAVFSKTEQEYAASHPPVRVAVLKNDSPYFNGTAEQPGGIIPQFFHEIASATGFSFSYQVYDSQTDAVHAVKTGDADLIGIFSDGITEAYSQGLILTRKYATVSTVMITNTGTETDHIHKIAVKERSLSEIYKNLSPNLQGIELVPFRNAEDCFAALTGQKVDAVVAGLPSATYLVNQRNSSAYDITPASSVTLELCAAAGMDSHMLVTILNKGINSVAYTFNGFIPNNTAAQDSLKTTIAKIPPAAIVAFAGIMTALVLLLLGAVFILAISRRTKVAAVKAEAAAKEERLKAETSEKSAEEKNAFFANISHDMRTPLNAITGFIRMARKDGISEKERNEYLKKADQSGELLLNLVDDTLTMSKAGSGKLQLYPEPVNNIELLESILVPVRETAARRNTSFSVDYSRIRERVIMADRLNMQKIFLNLLSNAVKYTPEGGHVSFEAYFDPEEGASPDTVVKISDNGIGISPEFMPRLFKPFTQEKRKGYAAVGTGLGLSIVKQLIDLMDGSIDVQSEKDHGTTFTVRLHFDETETKKEISRQPGRGAVLSGRKVLLCEDNELNREIAISLLNDKGISVEPAEDGEEGVKKFSDSAAGEFDAVLMDVRMPVMDGLEATREIRSMKRADAKTVPIIAMTADAFAEDMQKCLDAGMNGYIAKPIDPGKMYQALSLALAPQKT